jgi:hypothetical protein
MFQNTFQNKLETYYKRILLNQLYKRYKYYNA